MHFKEFLFDIYQRKPTKCELFVPDVNTRVSPVRVRGIQYESKRNQLFIESINIYTCVNKRARGKVMRQRNNSKHIGNDFQRFPTFLCIFIALLAPRYECTLQVRERLKNCSWKNCNSSIAIRSTMKKTWNDVCRLLVQALFVNRSNSKETTRRGAWMFYEKSFSYYFVRIVTALGRYSVTVNTS